MPVAMTNHAGAEINASVSVDELASPETIFVGIDPGMFGALSFFRQSGELIAVQDMPIVRNGTLKWVDGPVLLRRLRNKMKDGRLVAIVERVHAMPENGSQGGFSQGSTLCSLLAILQIANAKIELVAPQSWKRAMGLIRSREEKLTDSERKKLSLDKARTLFPKAPLDLEKHHGRAESLLIAHWYLEKTGAFRAAVSATELDAPKQPSLAND